MALPAKLGLPQEVEFEYNGFHRQYEGTLMAEGCRRGVCLRYRVAIKSKDGHNWEPAKPRRKELDLGGCLRQAAADALVELADRYEVGIWYEYRPLCTTFTYLCSSPPYMMMEKCGIMINGIKLSRPYCRTVEECVEKILRDYRSEVERLKEPPMRAQDDAATKFLKEHPELGAFGAEWIKEWLPYAEEQMRKIAEILRRYSKVKEVIEKVGKRENPYIIEVYLARDESEACVAFGYNEVFCANEKGVRKVPPDYVGQVQPRGLMAYVSRKEFIRVL